jgi:hypothetical protein
LRCSASTPTTTRCSSMRLSRAIARQIKSSSHAAGPIARMIRAMSTRRTARWCADWGAIDGLNAARELARLYAAARLFVSFFQPSFKLLEKSREGLSENATMHRRRRASAYWLICGHRSSLIKFDRITGATRSCIALARDTRTTTPPCRDRCRGVGKRRIKQVRGLGF